MPSVKVSVIVPVYNQQAYLTQCLESLQNQTLREIEILCVNDGSTDESWSLMQAFAARDSRFVLLNQPNQGTGRARNAALARARGEYVGFVDGDDFVDADYFEKLYQKAKEDRADVCCALDRREINGTRVQEVSTPVFAEADKFKKQLVFTAAQVWSKLFLRAFVQQYPLQNAVSRREQEIAFSIPAVLLARRISWVAGAYYNYRIQSASACRKPITRQDCEELPRIYAAMLALPLAEPQRRLVMARLKTNMQAYLRQVSFSRRIVLFRSALQTIPSFGWDGKYAGAYFWAKLWAGKGATGENK